MKIGLFSVTDHYPDELERSPQRLYDELLEQIVRADELGFDSFWLAEHHFHEYGIVPRPAVMLAAAAARTRRIKLGAGVVVLPFDNPLRVAEDYAMVDVISGGRLVLGVGSGYLQHEYEGFGVDPAQKRARFDESLEILMKAWSGERFDHVGDFYQLRGVRLNVTPLQRPMPPTAVAILRNEAARFVGARCMPIMMIPYATTEEVDELRDTVDAWRAAYSAAGGTADQAMLPFGLHVLCAARRREALSLARPAMDRYVRTRLFARQRPFDKLVEKDLVAFGTPEDIVRIARRYRAAGLTHMLAILNFGGLEHEQVLHSMDLLAREVLPHLS